jgi:hypothetical protein
VINFFQQNIYNCFLKKSRRGKPFKFRKNFDDVNESVLLYLKKLEAFFLKFPHIIMEDFFEAPNIIHPNEKYPYLDFFVSRKAIKAYQLFLRNEQFKPLNEQAENIKNCLNFIVKFCLSKNISLKDYSLYKENGSNMPVWSEHYRQHLLNMYVLVELIDWKNFDTLMQDEKELWFPGLQNDIGHFKINYHNSEETKHNIKSTINKLNKLTITNQLKKQNTI